ncbi:hypothetical protein HAX54_045428, partial [Datura stramonium]|nr:hypothetical protein [Datura stramonium]
MHEKEITYEYSTFDEERTTYEYDPDLYFQPPVPRIIRSPIHNILENKVVGANIVPGHDDTPLIYFDEASKSCEEDPCASCSIVITRTEKVVHLELCTIVEEEIHDDEKQCTTLDVAPRELHDEVSSEKEMKGSDKYLKMLLIKRLPLKNEELILVTHRVLDELDDMDECDPGMVLAIPWESDDLNIDVKVRRK